MSLINKLFVFVSLVSVTLQNQTDVTSLGLFQEIHKNIEDIAIKLSGIFELPKNLSSFKVKQEDLDLYTYIKNETDSNYNVFVQISALNKNDSYVLDNNELVTLNILNDMMNASFYDIIVEIGVKREFADSQFSKAKKLEKKYNGTMNLLFNDVNKTNETKIKNNHLTKRRKFRRSGRAGLAYRRKHRRFLSSLRSSKKFSFMVSIHYNGEFVGSGCIISSVMVISSASCLQRVFLLKESSPSIYIQVDSNFTKSSRLKIPVTNVIFHPLYDPLSLRNNLVLLVVDRNAFIGLNWLKKLKYKQMVNTVRDDESIKVIGWDISNMTQQQTKNETSKNGTSNLTDTYLFFNKFNTSNSNECTSIYSSYFVSKTNFCAKSASTSAGCWVNIGSTAIVNDTLLGVVSFGIEHCGMKDTPIVLTKIAPYAPWITKVLNKIKNCYNNMMKDNNTTMSNIKNRKFMSSQSASNRDIQKWLLIGPPPSLYQQVDRYKFNYYLSRAHKQSTTSVKCTLSKKVKKEEDGFLDNRKSDKTNSDFDVVIHSRIHPRQEYFDQVYRNNEDNAGFSSYKRELRYKTVTQSGPERISINTSPVAPKLQTNEDNKQDSIKLLSSDSSEIDHNKNKHHKKSTHKVTYTTQNHAYYYDSSDRDESFSLSDTGYIENKDAGSKSESDDISSFTKPTRSIAKQSNEFELSSENTMPSTVFPNLATDANGDIFRVGDSDYNYDEASGMSIELPKLRQNDDTAGFVQDGGSESSNDIKQTKAKQKVKSIATTASFKSMKKVAAKKKHHVILTSGEISEIAESVFNAQHGNKKYKRHHAKKSHKRSKKVPRKKHHHY